MSGWSMRYSYSKRANDSSDWAHTEPPNGAMFRGKLHLLSGRDSRFMSFIKDLATKGKVVSYDRGIQYDEVGEDSRSIARALRQVFQSYRPPDISSKKSSILPEPSTLRAFERHLKLDHGHGGLFRVTREASDPGFELPTVALVHALAHTDRKLFDSSASSGRSKSILHLQRGILNLDPDDTSHLHSHPISIHPSLSHILDYDSSSKALNIGIPRSQQLYNIGRKLGIPTEDMDDYLQRAKTEKHISGGKLPGFIHYIRTRMYPQVDGMRVSHDQALEALKYLPWKTTATFPDQQYYLRNLWGGMGWTGKQLGLLGMTHDEVMDRWARYNKFPDWPTMKRSYL